MKKLIRTAMILLLVSVLIFTAACDNSVPEQFSVTYSTSDGGYIQGNETQLVTEGENASKVTAIPFNGYKFVKWSDTESTAPVRVDTNVIAKIRATAVFQKSTLSVKYRVGESGYGPGGYIEGNRSQTVTCGEDAAPVTAKASVGSVFVEWSDGVTTAERHDKNVTANINLTANFVRTTQTLQYKYNGATGNNSIESVTLSWGKFDQADSFPVPEKTGFSFQGWFLEPKFINKAVNHVGQRLMGNEVLTKNFGCLYAKWVPEDTLVYPVLMIFVTEVQAALISTDGAPIDVDYKMSGIEKKICELIPLQLANYLNEWFGGLVHFEVDTYFTTISIGTACFTAGGGGDGSTSYFVMAYDIPEVGKFNEHYRSIMTTFGMDDYDNLLHVGGGCAGMKYASCHMETFLYGYIINNVPFERAYNWLIDFSHPEWEGYMGHYLHEFTHTVELNYEYGEIYDFHATENGLETEKLYLLNQLVIDGEKVGIPFSYWEGGINITAEYSADSVDGKFAGTIEGEGENINNGWRIKQNVHFGSDAAEVTAVAQAGYRFVKWSDGVTTATRKDTNVISYIHVRAIFEKID